MSTHHMPVIGLTGPIGCGKSTIARMLAGYGGRVIDADDLARAVTAPGQAAVSAIRERFGDGIVGASGSLDRDALARVVFSDPAALADLEAIVHPHVRRLVGDELRRAAKDGLPFVTLEAIKLIEGGLVARCDEVWLVGCDRGEQRARLRGRGMSDEDIERRIASQGAGLIERLEVAALEAGIPVRRVETSGTLESISERVGDALADVLEPYFAGLPLGEVQRPG